MMQRDANSAAASSAGHPSVWQGHALGYGQAQQASSQTRDRRNGSITAFQDTTNYPRNDVIAHRRSNFNGDPGSPPNTSLAPRANSATSRDGYASSHRRPSAYEYGPQGMSVRPSYGNVWRLLWLYPDISNLTSSLLAEIEGGWNYDAAFLLKIILELQSTYRRYLEAPHGKAGAIIPGPGTLLTRDTVLKVVRVFAGCLIPYNTKGFDDSISRELQFRVLATGLSLFTILDAKNIIHEVYHDLRGQLRTRDREIKNGRDSQQDVYGFGDGELLIRYSLDFLSNIPSDRSVNVTIFESITSLFFAAGLVYTWNGPEALRTLSVMSELPTKPHEWHKNFHELYCITLGAISLKRYASVVKDEKDKIQCEVVSKKIALTLIEKFDGTLRGEVEKLLKSRGIITRSKETVSAVTRNMGAEAIVQETHVAHALFYLINLLAREFGAQEFFKRAEDVCERFVVQSFESKEHLQMLRFKAYEILLTIEKKCRRDISLERRNFSIDNMPGRSGFFARKKESPEAIKNEIKLARERFLKKDQHESEALESGARRLAKRYHELGEEMKHYGYWREDQPSLEEPSTTSVKSVKSEPRSIKDRKNKSLFDRFLPDNIGPFFLPNRHSEDDIEHELDSEPVAQRSRLETINDGPESAEPIPIRPGHHLPGPGNGNAAVPSIIYERAQRDSRNERHERPMSPEYHGGLTQSPSSSPNLSSSPLSPRTTEFNDPFGPRRGSNRSYQNLPQQRQPLQPPPQPSRRTSGSSGSNSQYGRAPGRPHRPSQTAEMEIEKYKWMEPAVDLDIYVDKPEKYKLELKSRANYVTLSPDATHAAFIYEREILIRYTIKAPVISPHKTPLLSVAKKEGPFECACLSPTFLAAASHSPNSRIQITRYTSLALSSAQDPFRIALPPNCFPESIAMSPDSQTLAVGLRLQTEDWRTKQIENVPEIRLYALEELGITAIKPNFRYKPLATLSFPQPANKRAVMEFPTTMRFSADGGALLAAGSATIYTWKRASPPSPRPGSAPSGVSATGGQWNQHPDLPTRLPIPGAGGKSITSLTPFLRTPHSRPYVVVTSILSALPNKTSSFVTPLFTTMDIPALRGPYPEETHLCRSAVGPDGFVGAFLTQRGRLRIVKFHGGGCGLNMECVGLEVDCGVGAEDAPRKAAGMAITGGNGEWGVIVVDRRGQVCKVRVSGNVGEVNRAIELPEEGNGVLEMGEGEASQRPYHGELSGFRQSYGYRQSDGYAQSYGYELDASRPPP